MSRPTPTTRSTAPAQGLTKRPAWTQALTKTVAELTAPGKGILATDESTGTIEKRLKAVNVASTDETRRDYRELFGVAQPRPRRIRNHEADG